jgi:hypothetical protein
MSTARHRIVLGGVLSALTLTLKNHAIALERMMAKLLEVNQCPDFIEDRGHTYGRELGDDDKRALIEYVKTF